MEPRPPDVALSAYPHIPRFDPQLTGRLTITVGRRYAARNWNDTVLTSLDDRMGEVISGIIAFIELKRAEEAEHARREEAYYLAPEKYEREVERRESERKRLKVLQRDAARHRRAMQMREYLDACEFAARDAGALTPEFSEWLAWACAKADWIDPLIPMSDVVLDAPEPKHPSYLVEVTRRLPPGQARLFGRNCPPHEVLVHPAAPLRPGVNSGSQYPQPVSGQRFRQGRSTCRQAAVARSSLMFADDSAHIDRWLVRRVGHPRAHWL